MFSLFPSTFFIYLHMLGVQSFEQILKGPYYTDGAATTCLTCAQWRLWIWCIPTPKRCIIIRDIKHLILNFLQSLKLFDLHWFFFDWSRATGNWESSFIDQMNTFVSISLNLHFLCLSLFIFVSLSDSCLFFICLFFSSHIWIQSDILEVF